MATFEQACTWMEEGRRVRRSAWRNPAYSLFAHSFTSTLCAGDIDGSFEDGTKVIAVLSLEDIRARDWVLVAKKTGGHNA